MPHLFSAFKMGKTAAFKAHCTCGEKFEGIGRNDSEAMSTLWEIFLQHRNDKEKIIVLALSGVMATGIMEFAGG